MPCPECAALSAPGARFCDQCGRRLDLPGDGLQVGDRRVVTAVFADFVGYTKLVDELDAEVVRDLVDRAFGALADSVARFGGALEKFVGDAVVAVFGVPSGHDDDAARAALCALEMQSVLRGIDGRAGPLRVRIGIATGEVVAALRDVGGVRTMALTGDPMTTAARLQQLAKPGEVLADEATILGAGAKVDSERAGDRLLRGQRRPIPLYRVLAERRVVRQHRPDDSRLVGRDAEFESLKGMIEATARTARGHVALVRGEAGVGKSRLLAELEPAAREAGLGWIWIDNVSYGMKAPYRAARTMVEWLAGEEQVDPGMLARAILFGPDLDEALARRLAGAVAALARDSDMGGWDAEAPLAPVDPAEVLRDLRLTTRRFLSRLVAQRPRCIVVDDLHWVDPSSVPLIEEMAIVAAELPLVVLVGTRPPLLPDWVTLPHASIVELDGLDREATEELGRDVAGAPLADRTADWLHGRTGGNALFVKETVRALRAGGALREGESGLYVAGGAAAARLPLTLQALLGSRIDALPSSHRAILEVASVIGMTFQEGLLRDLGSDVVNDDALTELSDAGLLLRLDGEDGEAKRRWQFRHPLFHDAAYGRLLNERRKLLHSRLADRLAAIEPPIPAADLARHRVAAGDVEAALPLLRRAEAEARSIGAVAEARAFAEAAEALLVQAPETSTHRSGHGSAIGMERRAAAETARSEDQ